MSEELLQDSLSLRAAVPTDVPHIVEQEARPDFASFIFRWDADRHHANLSDPDKKYLIAESPVGNFVGYIILAGLASKDRQNELVRVVCSNPGKGLGRAMLQRAIDVAFNDLQAHRLWLDVFDDNERARHVYRTLGFREEGVLREVLMVRGEWRSLVVMSMLEEEWRSLPR